MTDDDARAFARNVFGDPPPPDAVPPTPITREELERISANYGKPIRGTVGGDIICDTDGTPIGVGESQPFESVDGGYLITDKTADRLGIREGELPGIHIIRPTKKDDTP